jgi:uncharacterized protein YhjY with autotransporter beta-barrel domain
MITAFLCRLRRLSSVTLVPAFVLSVLATPLAAQTEGARLEPVGATNLTAVLADALSVRVRAVDGAGRPLAGVAVSWVTTNDQGVPTATARTVTGNDGTTQIGASTGYAGRIQITASTGQAPAVVFSLTVQSLAVLTDGNSRDAVATAIDRICLEVFRPSPPSPTPLCVYMAGALKNQAERGAALDVLAGSGIDAPARTAQSGLVDQLGRVEGRLAALRNGGGGGGLAFNLDGVGFDGRLAQSGGGDGRLARQVDSALTRSGRGGGRGEQAAAAVADVEAQRVKKWGLFVTGRLGQGSHDTTAEQLGFDLDSRGLTVGVDRVFGTRAFLGLAANGLDGSTDIAGGAGDVDTKGTSFTLYGLLQGREHGYVQLAATAGGNSYEQRRNFVLPAVGPLTARAKYDGSQVGATLEGGWDWSSGTMNATVFGRGSWTRTKLDAYHETGAIADVLFFHDVDFGLAVGEQTLTSELAEAGVDLSWAISFSGGVLLPQLTVTYAHEFDGDARSARSQLLGDVLVGNSFELVTEEQDRSYLNAGAALQLQLGWGSVFVAYDRDFQRDDLELESVNAGLRFEL